EAGARPRRSRTRSLISSMRRLASTARPSAWGVRPSASGVPVGRTSVCGVTRESATPPPRRPGPSRPIPGARLVPPPVAEPRHAGVEHPGAHGEGVEPAVIVVRMPVARVHGHVEEIVPLDQADAPDTHGDAALAP